MSHKTVSVFSSLLLFMTGSILYSSSFATVTDNGRFNATSCTGDGRKAICTAVGFEYIDNKIYPLLVQSIDGGLTYKKLPIGTEPGSLLSVSCKRKEREARCIAVGYLGLDIQHSTPFMLRTLDNEPMQWHREHVAQLENGLLNGVTCYNDYQGQLYCAAIGYYFEVTTNTHKPILLESDENAHQWSIINIPGMPMNARLNKLDCGLEVRYVSCAAIGQDFDKALPFAIERHIYPDWEVVSFADTLDPTTVFEDVNCVSGQCGLTGRFGNNELYYTPFMASLGGWRGNRAYIPKPNGWSSDLQTIICPYLSVCFTGGHTVNQEKQVYSLLARCDLTDCEVIPESLIPDVTFKSMSCTQTPDFCIAVGDKKTPFVLQRNIGNPWISKAIANLPPQGILRASSCTGEAKYAICLSVGYSKNDDNDVDHPLLVQTPNAGSSWSVKEYY